MTDGDNQKPEGCEFTLSDTAPGRLSNQSVTEEVELFSTLANETRYRILLFLVEATGPVCGCELEPHFDVGQSTVSQSLNRLHKAGLVTRTKDGRWRYYESTPMAKQVVDLTEATAGTELTVVD